VKEIVGVQIKKIEVSDGEDYLRFTAMDGSTLCYKTLADCCSETWFADILNPDFVVGHKVRFVEEMDMGHYDTDDGRTRQEYDQVYGFRISTDAGQCDIVFRNSSNGYYGGWIEWVKSTPSGLVWHEVADRDVWTAPAEVES
jgi:hypothetical protein